jgi:hypothetical protein
MHELPGNDTRWCQGKKHMQRRNCRGTHGTHGSYGGPFHPRIGSLESGEEAHRLLDQSAGWDAGAAWRRARVGGGEGAQWRGCLWSSILKPSRILTTVSFHVPADLVLWARGSRKCRSWRGWGALRISGFGEIWGEEKVIRQHNEICFIFSFLALQKRKQKVNC